VISHVFESGPAKARGLRPGDRVVKVDEVEVDGPTTVEMMLAARKPGDPVEISVQSEDGQIFTAVLTLWERVSPVLRRSERASLSAVNAWRNLTHGEATTFAN
jgi:S1-C subfamily serine protease